MSKRRQAVVFQPHTYLGLQRGINQVANLIRPTLGPLPRVVAIELPMRRHQPPELLDDGATIARRIVELPDRDADVGAMTIRHVLLHIHDQVGDGTATAAVLMQSVYNQGVRYIASGGNAMRLRYYLEHGIRVILEELTGMITYPEGEEQLAHIAETICHDPPLAEMMGEIFDIIGEYGRLEIRSGRGRSLEREYVEGMYWAGGILSREMITNHEQVRTELEDAAILITDLKIDEPGQLVPALAMARRNGYGSLLVIAQELSQKAISLLLANSRPDEFPIAAVKAPGSTPSERGEALLDMAMLTGGRPLLTSIGYQTLASVVPQDLGRARRAWADPRYFGLVGGKGDPRALRKHIADLRAAYARAEDLEARAKIQERIGKLLSGSAYLWIGGMTKTEIETRQEIAERTAQAMRGALLEGVLPGGGVALLACRPALQRMLDRATDPDERAACSTLIHALAEPIRALASNAGYDPGYVMAQIAHARPGEGFDVRTGQVIEMAQAGIFDVAAAQKLAVRGAVSGAALALTTDVLVHYKSVNWYKPRSKY